jgi:hypothetical protein
MTPLAVERGLLVVAGGGWMAEAVNINDVLDGHVVLDLQCLDRVYLNGYVPQLQVGGQVVTFLTEHLGNPIPSPALFKQIGDGFRDAVRTFANSHGIPVLHLNTSDRSRGDDRKVDHVREVIDQATEPGVVAIVVAQEVQKVFLGYQRPSKAGAQFGFDKADRRVTVSYFYILDPAFGLGFITICSYFPYPLKVWVNGHAWAKRQATAEGLVFTELANGFASCADPARLQAICDRLSSGKLQAFFNSWIARLPCPFTRADRLAGYWWQLSMRHVEVSRTLGAGHASTCAGVVRGAGRRQHRHRPTRRRLDPVCSSGAAQYPEHLPHSRVHRRHPGAHRFHLQALPRQAVSQRGPRPAHRDRRQ